MIRKVSVLLLAFILLLALALPAFGQSGITDFTNLRLNNFLLLRPRTAETITNGDTLNPTGSIQRVTAAGAVGMSGAEITVKQAGTVLTLVNVGSNTITFTETGTLISAGNIALGAGDSATLVSDGTNWYQVAASNN